MQRPFRIFVVGIAGIALTVSLCFVLALSADEKQLTVVTPQDHFSVAVQQREGRDYVDLQNVLDSMGHSSATLEGENFKLHYGSVEAHFHAGQAAVKIGNTTVQLTGKFQLDNGRGWVPVSSLAELLPALTGGHAEYHEISRRLFLNGGGTRFIAELKKGSPSSLAISFTAPVNPRVTTESGKLKLTFSRDALVMSAQNLKYDDPLISSLHYSENENGGEMVIEASEPLLASFNDNGRTIVLSAAPKLATATPPAEAQPPAGTPSAAGGTASLESNPSSPAITSSGSATLGEAGSVPHTRYLIVIDPSHGGSERGAALSDNLAEKDVTLSIARRLRAELTDRGLVTFMIRDSDSTISLDQRAVVTNTSRAAVYVAIHAGTLGQGVRVYTSMLPETTLSPGTFLPWETAQSGYVRSSRVLAASVLDQISKNSRIPVAMMPAPVRPLNNIAGAAIAIEVAPQNGDVDSLTSSNYQQMIANALAAAIVYSRASLESAR